jgi:muconate cycloisomerase
MSTVQRVEVFPVRLPVTNTFRFASGSAGVAGDTAPLALVRLTDSEGATGWGEGRPLPAWSYETIESVTTTIRKYLAPAIIGLPITDRWGLHRRMQEVIGRGPSTGQPIAKAAVDMALHDLCARAAGLPLRCFLGGGPDRRRVALSYTVTAHGAPAARSQVAKASEEGYRHFNWKVAITPTTDVEVAHAIRDAAGPEAFVWADANQGYSLHEAAAASRGLAEAGVNVLEQPLPADQVGLMRRLRADCPLPLAVDEASVSPGDFFRYACEGLVDYLVLKLTRSGGIWPSLQQASVATAAGLPLLVSGLTDGLLTKVAVCQVAAAFGCEGPAGLNGSQFLDETSLYPSKAETESGGEVRLGDEPGIGVEPDMTTLRRMLAEELA